MTLPSPPSYVPEPTWFANRVYEYALSFVKPESNQSALEIWTKARKEVKFTYRTSFDRLDMNNAMIDRCLNIRKQDFLISFRDAWARYYQNKNELILLNREEH